MALDLSKVKSRLEALKNNTTKTTSLWRPKPGKHVVRIVPYSHRPENPFVELYFHYGMNNKTYISPSSFGRPDPIVEFSNKLKKSGDKEQWKQGRSLEPKMRTYVPILVRGEEDQGVKFWGIGKQVYQEILSIIADPDYGDITDLKAGRDVVVEFKDAKETGKNFPETTIRVKPNQSVAFDAADRGLLEKVKNQKDLLELWPELSYDELAKVMDTWLNAPSDNAEHSDETAPTESNSTNTSTDVSAAVAASPKTESVTEKQASIKAPSTAKAVADEFDELFNNA